MSETIESLVDNLGMEKKTVKPVEKILEIVQEQIEAEDTTVFCPESLKEKELRDLHKNPEFYLEVNIVKTIRIVDTFYIKNNIKVFHYKKMVYNIVEEHVYLLPSKKGFFMPTCFYYENNIEPVSFKQTNKGITGKAFSLLYDENLYSDMFSVDENKYNLVIVILLSISIGSYLLGLYYLFKGWGVI
jgi:hypothetical protein